MGFYRGEVMFYRELADRTKTKTPKCYAAEINQENNFVLLLEDLAPATAGDHMAGCSVNDARLAMKEAAFLHAAFWNDHLLEKQDWLYVPDGAQGFYTTDLIHSSWDYFRATHGSQMDPKVIEVCDQYVASHEKWNQPRSGPKCFSHNDFRVDNMLFSEKQVAVVDWQTSNYLSTGMDVAYFIGSAFNRDTRQAVEHDLLREYHQTLLAEGVLNYELSQLKNDYMHYSFAVLAVAIAAAVIVKRSERGDRLFIKMVTDGAYQALDNGAMDLL
jgi:thiamine kinase-like enzyme